MIRKPLRRLSFAACVLVATALTQSANAQTNVYTDATGDEFTGTGQLDITSVEVSNGPFDMVFKINLAGDPIANQNYKYCIAFDTVTGGSATNAGWNRPIVYSAGMDYWVGTWVDGGSGGQLWEYTTGAWSQISGAGVSTTTNSVTVNVPLIPMGLSAGDSFGFDIYTTGGSDGDAAIDALGTTNQTVGDWATSYDSGSDTNSYTIAASSAPTNQITFRCDMEVPIALFDADFSDPNGFDTNNDVLVIRGDFNGWATDTTNYSLARLPGTTLFSNTVDVVAAAGSTINYKFFGSTFPGEENVLLSCNATRQLEITSQTLTAPLAYWGDQRLTDPDRLVSFSVDMSYQETLGNFTNGVNTVSLRGDINGWGETAMTNGPAPDTNVFTTVLTYPYTPTNGCLSGAYKFFTDSSGVGNGGWENNFPTGSNNREFQLTSADQTIPTAFWNDVDPNNFDPCQVLNAETMVTFSIDMTGAVGTDATVYTGTNTVYLNGGFLGWWGWGAPGPAQYALTKNPTSDVHSITLALPAFQEFRLQYKYSLGGADNEGGFGSDHVRYVRANTEGASVVLPQDVWINTNPGADITEDELGSLSIADTGGGTVELGWEGLPCTMMQWSSNLSGPWTDLFEARGVTSTNLAAGAAERYYRMEKP